MINIPAQTLIKSDLSRTAEVQTIAIIGGGFSGTMVALHLLKTATTPLQIYLVEPRSQVGQGLAYSSVSACHLLNIPASNGSTFAEQPDHFVRWLSVHAPGWANPMAFVPRLLYGRYVQDQLQIAIANAAPNVVLEHCCDTAVDLTPTRIGFHVTLSQGRRLQVDQVVLALGTLPPDNPPIADPTFYQSDRYHASPWEPDAFTEVQPNEAVLLIGSGLTAVDAVLSLRQQGHQGPIHLVSRRGLLPQAQSASPCHSLPQFNGRTVRSLLRQVRHQVRQAEATGGNWRSVINALRPQTQTLWQTLSQAEKQRFLRHVKHYWDVHRHRMAPAIAQSLAAEIQSGTVQRWAGRICAYRQGSDGVEVWLRLRGEHKVTPLYVQRVINCTNPSSHYAEHPLVQTLAIAGLIQPDALGLGLAVTSNGALLSTNGIPSRQLFTLGAPCKGHRWETTAIPEIGQQAASLAKTLLLARTRVILS